MKRYKCIIKDLECFGNCIKCDNYQEIKEEDGINVFVTSAFRFVCRNCEKVNLLDTLGQDQEYNTVAECIYCHCTEVVDDIIY